ncbi:MAG: hypothetical protein K0R99_5014 [Microbacterium sp.]|nr:hypothetical protein [Microbacterium sp.]
MQVCSAEFAAYGMRKGMRPQWLTALEEISDGDILPKQSPRWTA